MFQSGYKHGAGASQTRGSGIRAQCDRMRYQARLFADTCGRPGWPRSAGTRMFGNGADGAGRGAPDEEILEKCARVQGEASTQPLGDRNRPTKEAWGTQSALGAGGEAGLVCVRRLKGEPCSSEYSNESDGEEAGLRDGLKQVNVCVSVA